MSLIRRSICPSENSIKPIQTYTSHPQLCPAPRPFKKYFMSKVETKEYLFSDFLLPAFSNFKNVVNFMYLKNGGHSRTVAIRRRNTLSLRCLAYHVTATVKPVKHKQVLVCVRNKIIKSVVFEAWCSL